MEKVKGKREEVRGKGLSESFNNPGLLLGSLCFAEISVWNVYDDLTEKLSMNNLILTRSEKREIDDAASNLLLAYTKLCKIAERRMKSAMSAKEGGAK